MPRIRTIKPEHWDDAKLPKLSFAAHLTWIGMWNFSDDKGVIDADPVLIKNKIFPRRKDIGTPQFVKWLDQLTQEGFIIPFDYANRRYYVTRTFQTHQRIDKPQDSKIPEEVIVNVLSSFNSKNVPGTVASVLYSTVQESKGEGSGPPAEFLKKNNEKKKLEKKEISPPPKYPDVLEFFDGRMNKQWNEQKVANEAGKFFNHYGGMGWKIKGYAIEDWEKKAVEWMIKECEGTFKKN